jgi:hypothetical protein
VEDIQARFHLNQSQAAADMGFKCVSSFNDACKRFSVQHWQRQGASTNFWTKEEDKKVVDGVARWGVKAWAVISEELPGRHKRHVRERWMNSLDPAVKKGGWTAEEDKLLGDLHSSHGRSWTTIAALLGGRAPKHVKNHWAHLEAVKATCEREETMQGGLFSRLVDVPSKCVPKPKVAQPNFQDASGQGPESKIDRPNGGQRHTKFFNDAQQKFLSVVRVKFQARKVSYMADSESSLTSDVT